MLRDDCQTIVSMLLGFFAWPGSLLGWPIAIGCTCVSAAVARSWKGGALAIVLSPMFLLATFGVATGTSAYFRGTALIYHGPRGVDVDPQTRARYGTSGCVRSGFEPFVEQPSNVAVRVLSAVCGPMRGAYTGPYPTRKETELLLQTSPDETLLYQGRVKFFDGIVCPPVLPYYWNDLHQWTRVWRLGEGAIVLAYPDEWGEGYDVFLFDLGTMRKIARYRRCLRPTVPIEAQVRQRTSH